MLRAAWPRIDVTTVDVSLKAMFTDSLFNIISTSTSLSAQYIAKYATRRTFLWDEVAAASLIEPRIITKTRDVYMDVDISHGPSYGHTLTWAGERRPVSGVRMVHAQVDLDLPAFTKLFVRAITGRP